jgi:hypothetical protein
MPGTGPQCGGAGGGDRHEASWSDRGRSARSWATGAAKISLTANEKTITANVSGPAKQRLSKQRL